MRRLRTLLLVGMVTLLVPASVGAQGVMLPGSGAAHLSMGGASTAAAIDAAGANYWNPAVISALPFNEAVIGGQLIYPDIRLGSRFPTAAGDISGSTRSDNGLGLISGLGVVYHQEDTPLTFGLGLNTVAGGGVNFPGDPENPVLAPGGRFGVFTGGPIYSNLTVLQIAPAVSYQVTDRLAVGFSPLVDVAIVSFDPAFFATPNDANGDGLFTFPTATHTRPFWGGGFRVGALFKATDTLDVGLSYTSPQWFEKWRFYASDEAGNPRDLSLKANLPMILSGGLAYRGIDRLTLAADVRYFDYKNTDLFGTRIRDGGLGWRDVWAVAVGGQYDLSDRVAVRLGYLYNQNPVPDFGTLFNAQTPGVLQHQLSVGTTVRLNDSIALSLAYIHGFNNEISGAVLQAPGVNNTLSAEADSLAFGLHIRFGCRRERCAAPCDGGSPCEFVAPAQVSSDPRRLP